MKNKPKYELHAAVTTADGATTTRRIFGCRDKARIDAIVSEVKRSRAKSARKSELRPPSRGNCKTVEVVEVVRTTRNSHVLDLRVSRGAKFPTVAAFAHAVGLTPERVSQYMSRQRSEDPDRTTFTVRNVRFSVTNGGAK